MPSNKTTLFHVQTIVVSMNYAATSLRMIALQALLCFFYWIMQLSVDFAHGFLNYRFEHNIWPIRFCNNFWRHGTVPKCCAIWSKNGFWMVKNLSAYNCSL